MKEVEQDLLYAELEKQIGKRTAILKEFERIAGIEKLEHTECITALLAHISKIQGDIDLLHLALE